MAFANLKNPEDPKKGQSEAPIQLPKEPTEATKPSVELAKEEATTPAGTAAATPSTAEATTQAQAEPATIEPVEAEVTKADAPEIQLKTEDVEQTEQVATEATAENPVADATKNTPEAAKTTANAAPTTAKAPGKKGLISWHGYKLIIASFLGMVSFTGLYLALLVTISSAVVVQYSPDVYPEFDTRYILLGRELTEREIFDSIIALYEVDALSRVYAVQAFVEISDGNMINNRIEALGDFNLLAEEQKAIVVQDIADRLILSEDHLAQIEEISAKTTVTMGEKAANDLLKIAYDATDSFLQPGEEALTNAYALYTIAGAMGQEQAGQISLGITRELALNTSDAYAVALERVMTEREIDPELLIQHAAATPEPPVEEPSDPEPPVEEPSNPEPPVEEPSDPEPPVEEPSDPEPPVEEPSNPEPPVEEPSDPEPPVEEPSDPEPPVEEPSNPEPPVEEPSDPEPPVEEPSSSSSSSSEESSVPRRPNPRFFRTCGGSDEVTNGKYCAL